MGGQSFILSKFYRNFAILFFAAAFFMLLFIFYLIWARVTIIVTPVQQDVKQEFVVDVKEGATLLDLENQNAVDGKITQVEVEKTMTFTATGSKPAAEDTIGEVTIINNYSQPQTLIETTRLADPADPETVLVRLKNTVTVPAGETIKVQVYSDNPDTFENIKPMRFIIPGLWEGLQDNIYAENEETLGEGGGTVAFVTEADLVDAEEEMKKELFGQAMSSVNDQLEPQQTLWPKLVSSNGSEVTFDSNVGDEVSEFSATMKMNSVVVVFDETKVIALAREKLSAGLQTGKQLVAVNSKSLDYAIEQYDLESKVANLKVSIEGGSVLSESSQLLEKGDILGKTEEEVKNYFSQFSEVESVEVIFKPAWLKKTPRLRDKIDIEIVK